VRWSAICTERWILFKVLTKKFVKDGASQFQNFHVNIHMFHSLFSARISQIGQAVTTFAQDGFNSNEELMEGVKTWLSSMAVDFFGHRHIKTFLDMTCASIQAVTTLRSSLSMCLFFVCNTICFDRLCGLVVRVSGYRSRGLAFDSRRFQIFWEAVGLERGPLSLVSTREYNWGATWKK
jgi:hypothetical protein